MVRLRWAHAVVGLVVIAVLGGCSSAGDGDTATSTANAASATSPSHPAGPAGTPGPGGTPGDRVELTAEPKPTKGHPRPNKTWTPSAKPKVKPVPSASTVKPGATQTGVTAGAFCSPQGATGRTAEGATMRCVIAQGDERARWRAV